MTLLHDCLLLKFAGLCLIDKGGDAQKIFITTPYTNGAKKQN